ncbi:MAG: NAD(P)/FAD-dependent oxidoreductase [Candidatus Omnitrophica bacterium]|nr:NAD(P)/FAD-dependent oxidoreductase [Candidatus Omnitrophota bacterium]
MEKVEITIIGAGAVGLAIACGLSKKYRNIVVAERHESFGQETSSRNSEVVHAGIYYPKDSLKARLCVEGKELLYRYCAEHNIAYKRIGKLIVACDDFEVQGLEKLFKHGLRNLVTDMILLSSKEIKRKEPHINAKRAVYSPSTGIFDSHGLMKNLAHESESRGVQIAYSTEVVAIEKQQSDYKITVKDSRGDDFCFLSRIVINSAGLNADKVARLAGIENKAYEIKYCKGNYFRVHNNKARFLNHLIYPVPGHDGLSLGIHTVLDLSGGLRLGPDVEYIDKIDYNVNDSKKKLFHENARRFLSFIELEDLSPDMAGIRAKLQGPLDGFRDFIIKEETEKGFSGFINLIGIDSPGLTCCFSLAQETEKLVKGFF